MKPLTKRGLLLEKVSSSLAISVARISVLEEPVRRELLSGWSPYLLMRRRAVGPPMREPATRPKVAAAMETTLPPTAPAASQFRSVGCCRAGAAHQGDRAAADAQKWILAEQGHESPPQKF